MISNLPSTLSSLTPPPLEFVGGKKSTKINCTGDPERNGVGGYIEGVGSEVPDIETILSGLRR